MPIDTAQQKKQVHELIDQLTPNDVAKVHGLLEAMFERAAVAEADEWLKHNNPISHEEVLADFGLTMADWEKMAEAPAEEETPRRNG
jgi:hypothetical protein